MAQDDQTLDDDKNAAADPQSGSSATSTGRDNPAQEAETEWSEATLDILDDEEKIAIGLMPDPNAEPEGDDTAPADGDDTAEGADGDDTAAAVDGEDTAKAAEGDDTAPAAEGAAPDLPPAIDRAALDELDTERKTLMKEMRDGEITEDEFEEKLEDLQARRDEASREIARAEGKRDQWFDRWNQSVQDYQKEAGDLFGEAHRDTFDKYVRQVTGDTRPQVQKLSMRQKLERAHRLYQADADLYDVEVPPLPGKKGKADPKPDPKAQAAADKAAKEKKAGLPPKEDPAEPAPTLNRVPASATPDAGEGEFSRLHALEGDADPEKLESEIARLKRTDPAAYERYMEA